MSSLAPTDNQGLLLFLSSWYGPPKPLKPQAKASPETPRELAEWHELSTRWDGRSTRQDDDHSVYEREPSDEPCPWHRTGERLSEFLVHATVLETILGAPATKVAEDVDVDWLWFQEGVHELPFPGNRPKQIRTLSVRIAEQQPVGEGLYLGQPGIHGVQGSGEVLGQL
jgi:hypothetical protein